MSTARLLAKRLDLDEGTWSASFQSRLGREKWLTPYTTEELRLLAERGIKRLLVYSPAFVCDCLETLFEIQEEYAEEFIQYGGEKLQLVQGLNAHPAWIHALKDIVLDHSPNRSEPVEGVELSQQPLWN